MQGHGDVSLYFSVEPDEAYAYLRGRGWEATVPVETSYGFRQVSTKDPDGFHLCFHHPSKRQR